MSQNEALSLVKCIRRYMCRMGRWSFLVLVCSKSIHVWRSARETIFSRPY